MKEIAINDVSGSLENIIKRGSVIIVDSSMEFSGVAKRIRATNLILKGRAYELIGREDSTGVASHSLVGDPLILALNRYVPKRKLEIDFNSIVSKKMILNRDGYICSYCGKFGNTVDHIVPKSQGGLSSWGNLTTSCKECNGKKGDLSLEQVGYSVPKIPKTYIPKRNLEMQEAIYKRLAESAY